jgi:nucleotide-binding universal stress UspA family protein
MASFLVPIDGSEHATRAVDYVIERASASRDPIEVHLLTVQVPLTGVNVKLLVSRDSIEDYYREEGTRILEPSLERLRAAHISVTPHIGVGDAATVIGEYAKNQSVQEIVMGSHGRGAVAGALMGSVAQKVVHVAAVPVVIVK